MTNTDDSHECPAPACSRRVPRSMLACREHWYAIPADLRAEVWAAYRHAGMGSDRHTAAIRAAIAWLEQRYGSAEVAR